MGEVPLSLHVDTKLKEKLDNEARLQKVSADDVAQRAIASYLEYLEREREILRERIAEADKGIFISEEAMNRWVESWGTDNELPPPEPDIFPDK
ncbi:MAG: CopG family ribbon-helix-helix protein [Rhizobiaceae bacterium]